MWRCVYIDSISILTFYLTFFLAYTLTFYLAYLLTFFLAFFLAFYLAYLQRFFVVEARRGTLRSSTCSWGPAGNTLTLGLLLILLATGKPSSKILFLILGCPTGKFQTPNKQDSNLYPVNPQPTTPWPIPSITRPKPLWAWAGSGPRSKADFCPQTKVRIQSAVRKSFSPTWSQATTALSSRLTALKL